MSGCVALRWLRPEQLRPPDSPLQLEYSVAKCPDVEDLPLLTPCDALKPAHRRNPSLPWWMPLGSERWMAKGKTGRLGDSKIEISLARISWAAGEIRPY